MSLSVIVTSYGSPDSLRRCLEALVGQKEAEENMGADCSTDGPSPISSALCPSVRFISFSQRRTVPQMRWEAFRHTTGPIVAAIESRCRPASDWCAALLRAHEAWPDAPAAGGPVVCSAPASKLDQGLYVCEYGLYAPPAPGTAVQQLSGAALSYKRQALECQKDLLDAGAWETLIHER